MAVPELIVGEAGSAVNFRQSLVLVLHTSGHTMVKCYLYAHFDKKIYHVVQ